MPTKMTMYGAELFCTLTQMRDKSDKIIFMAALSMCMKISQVRESRRAREGKREMERSEEMRNAEMENQQERYIQFDSFK